ncbi:hypothetical protein DICVIV_14458 [Dictyocaulus viviparus]|uniref:Uncharacterized protein n=1 Tax=Dictyocaulus viviparus TaxID=29172 RepID=A0A0D8X536_DICVI|nr:hypothetical protein DICVIV_14458 [Dictyocaulus viviparus]
MSGSIARMTESVLLNVVYAHWGPKGVWKLEIIQLVLVLSLWLIFLNRLVPLEKLSPIEWDKSYRMTIKTDEKSDKFVDKDAKNIDLSNR